jgi:hypothetical protein
MKFKKPKLKVSKAERVSAEMKSTKRKDVVRSSPKATHLSKDVVRSSPKTTHVGKKPRKDTSANLGHYLFKSKMPTGSKIGAVSRKMKTI